MPTSMLPTPRRSHRPRALFVAFFALVLACSDSPTAPQTAARVVVAPTTLTLASGASGNLTASVEDEQGRVLNGRTITWISANPDAATVSSTGLVTARVNLGAEPVTTTILAAGGGQVGSAVVTVSPAAVAQVQLGSDTTRVTVGDAAQLTVIVRDGSGGTLTGRSVSFASLDTAVASVLPSGIVTARDYTGPATRTARIVASLAGQSDTAIVVVAPLAVAAVAVLEDSLELVQGSSAVLTFEARASDGRLLPGRAVTWASSDSARLQVSGSGALTASAAFLAAPVSATVTATSEGLAAAATITIVSGFELAENGITVRCPLAAAGDSAVVEGRTYTKRTREDLDILVAARQHAAVEASCISGVTNLSALFADTDFDGRIEHWDVSAVTRMDSLFFAALNFNKPLAAWDVRKVTRMDDMFRLANRFNQPLGSWDTRSVTDMTRMFSSALAFNQPIGGWNVRNVTSMRAMFQNARAFNQPLDSWNVGSVTTMSSMFALAIAFDQPLNAWDVSRVTTMAGMFEGAESFNRPLDAWDVGAVTDMSRMFVGALAFNGQVDRWDVSQVTTMRSMFAFAPAFNRSLSGWNVSAVTDFVSMFQNASAFNQDLSVWCVPTIASAPTDFASGASAWTRPRPAWSTCSPISTEQSTVTLTPAVVVGDGVSTIEVMVRVRNHRGLFVSVPIPVLSLTSQDFGTVGPLSQIGTGWFVATFTSSTSPGIVRLDVPLDGPAKTISATIVVTP